MFVKSSTFISYMHWHLKCCSRHVGRASTVDCNNTLAHKRTATRLKRNKQTLLKSGLVAIVAVTPNPQGILQSQFLGFCWAPLKQLLLLKFQTLLCISIFFLFKSRQPFLVFKPPGDFVLCFPSIDVNADGCQVVFAYAYVAKLWPPYW